MEYRRTAVIKLDIPEGADLLLRETVEQFKHCANTASDSIAYAGQPEYDNWLRLSVDITPNPRQP